jgi:hypothetical protein
VKKCSFIGKWDSGEAPGTTLERGRFVVSTSRRKLDNQQLISQLGGHARWGKCEADKAAHRVAPQSAFHQVGSESVKARARRKAIDVTGEPNA